MHDHLIQLFFLIFSGAAVFASLALVGRQPLLVAYIALGAVIAHRVTSFQGLLLPGAAYQGTAFQLGLWYLM